MLPPSTNSDGKTLCSRSGLPLSSATTHRTTLRTSGLVSHRSCAMTGWHHVSELSACMATSDTCSGTRRPRSARKASVAITHQQRRGRRGGKKPREQRAEPRRGLFPFRQIVAVAPAQARSLQLADEGLRLGPRSGCPHPALADEHQALMPQRQQPASGGGNARLPVHQGPSQRIFPAERAQRKGRDGLGGQPGEHLGARRQHDPGIGLYFREIGGDAFGFVSQSGHAGAGKKAKVPRLLDLVLKLRERALPARVFIHHPLVEQHAHAPRTAAIRLGRAIRQSAAAAQPARLEKPLGLELPERGADGRRGNLQLHTQRDHPWQQPAPLPGAQPGS